MNPTDLPNMPLLTEDKLGAQDPAAQRVMDALASLNQIGAAINRFSPNERQRVRETLTMIVQSAVKVVPGSAAILYTYDWQEHTFDTLSRVTAGDVPAVGMVDVPRSEGIGARAVAQRRRVISYEETDLSIHPALVAAGARATACFPLVVANHTVGVLYVYLMEARQFSLAELLLLDNFVNQAAMAIHQARQLEAAQRDLKRKETELERLRRAGLLISSRLNLDETLKAILLMALEVTDAHHGIFRLVDASGESLVTSAVAGDPNRALADAMPIDDDSIMGWVASHRQPLCIHDLHAAPWVQVYHPLYTDMRMRSELAVPLVGSSGRLEGVLNLESPVIGAFTDEDSHLLQSLATQAVIAIQETRLLNALMEAGRLLLAESYEQVLQTLVSQACDLLNVDAGAIWLLKDDDLVLQASNGDYERGETLPLDTSLTGRVVREGKVLIVEDIKQNPAFHRPDLAKSQDWGGALIVPIFSSADGQPVGAFSVYGTRLAPGNFTESEWDQKILMGLAYYVALAVHNAQRQDALRLAQEQRAVAETFAGVGDIAANVLHHLNNKVGTIPVRIQGIEDKCATSIAAQPYLASNLTEIERSAREALDAVRDNLSRLRPLHASTVSILDCVQAAVLDTQLDPGIDLSLRNLDSLPTVNASKQNLVFVFTNLLENAAEAMQNQGHIIVHGEVVDHEILVYVIDDGPGIPLDIQALIFDFEFSARKTKRPGRLGFGLWWVKSLLMRLGGSITVHSDGHNGTTFTLKLPLQEGP